ncbi:MAG TPA: C25 family cysteine peptidase, partial [Bacteroidia bacterium]|nr:C25 family cysteine peptidase [Bacteroidia bacterium]
TRKVSYTPGFSYLRGFQDFYGLSLSAYTTGEGFAGPVFTNTSNPTFATLLHTPNAVAGNTPMRLKMRVQGANLRDHFLNVTLNNVPVFNTAFVQYNVVDTNLLLPNIVLSNTINAEFTALPNPDNSVGSMAVNYMELYYNHSFNFATETAAQYHIAARGNFATPFTRWDISNLNFQQPILLLWANDTIKRIALYGSGNNFQTLLPTYGFDKNCVLLDSASQTYTNDAAINFDMKPVRAGNPLAPVAHFTNFAFNPNAQLILITNQKLWAAAETYKTYRQSNPYNTYTTLLADANELYDQFANGISKHPLAIKNFIRYTRDNFTIKPEQVFLIGKSIKNFLHITNQGIPGFDDDNLVPTFGEPPSDLMFTTGLLTNDSVTRPALPVGRLSAATPQDVTDYLEKVMAYEAQPNNVWMKNVLHFAGGVSIQQRQDIESKLAEYATIISDSAFGGYVRTISKTVTDPIQIALSNQLQQIIDSGVSLMTFYAHAGASTFDISTDEPASWKNKDRYPLVLGNSCYVGDAHQKGRAAAENFVLQKNKGAIGFIGSASVNYIENLYPYAKSLYQHISLYNYGNSIGRCLIKGIDTTWANYNAGFYTETVTIGMNLQGDPTLIINAAEKPDFEITASDISFNPTSVTAIADSFDVNIVIKNIGMATNSAYIVEVSRTFGNGTTTDSVYVRPALTYTDTLKLRFAVDAAQGPGLNLFTVKVDPFGAIAELNDSTNNEAQQQLYILSNDITPIYPPPFAIVGNNSFQLQASTVNQFAPVTRYVFELDTTDAFNSAILWHDTVTAAGGYITKNLPYTPVANTVYYWRVSRDSVAGDPIHPAWNEASFIYIANQNGWSQAHFYQFKNNTYTNINYNRPQQRWDYVSTKSVLKAET